MYMKKILLFLCLTFCGLSMAAQTGYWYGSEFINLVADGSGCCYVQLSEADAASVDWVKEHPELFVPLGREGYVTTEACVGEVSVSYRSKLYTRADENDNGLPQEARVVILPRVVMKLKNGADMDELKAEYGDKFAEVKTNKVFTTIECNLSDAVQVFDLVNELVKNACVEWCEPDMISGFDIFVLGLSAPKLNMTDGSTTVYDLQGSRVTGTPRPGIYIENGRKRVVGR